MTKFPSRKPYKGSSASAAQLRDMRGRINARIDRIVERIRVLENIARNEESKKTLHPDQLILDTFVNSEEE